jgi:hypothetical protein
MEEESLVRSVVQKSAARTAERRLEKRQAAQSRRRVRLTDAAAAATRGAEDISEKEVQALVNLCKGGKISAPELKILSQVGRKAAM